ncbi:MAG: nucleoside deaminase [Hyphomicrobiaceae bacterium]|nr:nucleoside deaminase [Hyphomicrobiaceae bacterium]MCC0023006.1 nucleoside deaminase [Hyphomicrobiaceae bacterium]
MSERPDFMKIALDLARKAGEAGEVPVAALLVHDGEIIASAPNRMRELNDPTAHAEMLALREALGKRSGARLDDCDLYVTLEPCTMCAGAIAHARVRRLYYAARDPKAGAVESGVRFFDQPTCHHRPEVISGIREDEAAEMLRRFFAEKR